MEEQNNQLMKITKGLSDATLLTPLVELLKIQEVKPMEVIRGIIKSEKSDLLSKAVEIGESVLKNNYTEKILETIKDLNEQGKIAKDYFPTNQSQATLLDFLKFIDKEPPEEEIFKAMNSIFAASISKDTTEQDRILTHLLLQITKQLKSGDVLLLKACYKASKEIPASEMPEFPDTWVNIISNRSGILKGLVELYEVNLVKAHLISDRRGNQRDIILKENFRLNDTGIKFCEFIANYS